MRPTTVRLRGWEKQHINMVHVCEHAKVFSIKRTAQEFVAHYMMRNEQMLNAIIARAREIYGGTDRDRAR